MGSHLSSRRSDDQQHTAATRVRRRRRRQRHQGRRCRPGHRALIGDRFKLSTPQPATPAAVAKTIAAIVNEFGWSGRSA
ncbi:hypothetical protein I553_1480 [Mycobacterium xenopi 4042]|uniref:Uncharacterized protein n=1 Tax=Mycobacterium xenopi 4042 TaxID=1299334 RepID=X8CEK5_MYCXE|nr:hypothetical protein I553_1480 [Mycobacterium xenopi 4042]